MCVSVYEYVCVSAYAYVCVCLHCQLIAYSRFSPSSSDHLILAFVQICHIILYEIFEMIIISVMKTTSHVI